MQLFDYKISPKIMYWAWEKKPKSKRRLHSIRYLPSLLIQFLCQYVQQAAECKHRVSVQKHFVYILQPAVHTVPRNWISRLGRYLMLHPLFWRPSGPFQIVSVPSKKAMGRKLSLGGSGLNGTPRLAGSKPNRSFISLYFRWWLWGCLRRPAPPWPRWSRTRGPRAKGQSPSTVVKLGFSLCGLTPKFFFYLLIPSFVIKIKKMSKAF